MDNNNNNQIEIENENKIENENENDKIFNQKLLQDYQKLMQNKNESDFKLIKKTKKLIKKNKENQEQKQENEKQKQEINQKNKENQEQKQENEKQKQEINQKNQEINQIKLIYEEMKSIYEENKSIYEEMKSKYEEKLQKAFSDSEIIKEIEMMKKLKEWINDEFFYKMKKGFSTKKDGFTGNQWHSICDNKGKTLIIIKTTDNYIFGGFTQVGFISGSDRYIKDSNAFIFSLKNPKNNLPQKFEIQENREDYAINYDSSYGPRFGDYHGQYNTDILIQSDLHKGRTDFGATYKLPNGLKHKTDEAKSYLAGSYSDWKVDELETYFI
ncbi:hypothetical protein M0811_07404 [Anaeramoeba ignava]|uniref:TLDc domain-containing protein n=1 Tax=Anaeramoeba ignava TaxID=1746090 RepID=A0A9Q0RE67_ANAIG|nr:hypothetical protein M0811_07404 [Anaeramoeba ignava]